MLLHPHAFELQDWHVANEVHLLSTLTHGNKPFEDPIWSVSAETAVQALPPWSSESMGPPVYAFGYCHSALCNHGECDLSMLWIFPGAL